MGIMDNSSTITPDDIFNKLNTGIVFFDFDGVLSTYRSLYNRVIIGVEDFIRYSVHSMDNLDNLFQSSRAPKVLVEGISKLETDRVYVLSVVLTSIEAEAKREFIAKHYPNIDPKHIIFVGQSSYKKLVMECIYDKEHTRYNLTRSSIYLVDDSLDVIEDAEKAGFGAFHISELLY